MGSNDLQHNYQGFLSTPLLWENKRVYGLEQYAIESNCSDFFSQESVDHLRLGKLVERFVSHQLTNQEHTDIIAENIQVQDGKKTIGELDLLLRSEDLVVHLEIVYKFYLYDPSLGNDGLSPWIGPNRNDHLLYKLNKLKEKQLPLLYHPKTKLALKDLQLDFDTIVQKVLFKAQLFLPLNYHKNGFHSLNPECVKGFYINREALERFSHCQFFIPSKINWLMDAHDGVAWINYAEFIVEVDQWLNTKRAPLCWLKEDRTLHKFFVVWW